jgi:phosphoglycolate phosphatase
MPVEALIFDLDGTLVDTAPDLWAATNHVMKTLKRRPVTMEEVRSFVGHGAKALIARGCEATGDPVDARAIESLYQEFVIYYAANIAEASKPYPGLMAFLDRCRASGLVMGVCTNKLESLSVRLVHAMGLSPYFGAIVGPDTIGVAKPDPRPLRETLQRLGKADARVVMFGDSETDIKTAHNAGVPVIAVSFGYTPQHVSTFNPTRVINHYDEAWAAVQAIADQA